MSTTIPSAASSRLRRSLSVSPDQSALRQNRLRCKIPFKSADAVAITILKRARVDFIDDSILPRGQLLHLTYTPGGSFCRVKVCSHDQRSLVQKCSHLLTISCYLYGCKW